MTTRSSASECTVLRKTSAAWSTDTTIYRSDVMLVPIDGVNAGKHKLSDGVRTYAQLPFLEDGGGGGGGISSGSIILPWRLWFADDFYGSAGFPTDVSLIWMLRQGVLFDAGVNRGAVVYTPMPANYDGTTISLRIQFMLNNQSQETESIVWYASAKWITPGDEYISSAAIDGITSTTVVDVSNIAEDHLIDTGLNISVAGTWEPNSVLGIAFGRNGANDLDTYGESIFSMSLRIDY